MRVILVLLILCGSASADRWVLQSSVVKGSFINQAAATTAYNSHDTIKVLGTASNVRTGFVDLVTAGSSRRIATGSISNGFLPSGTYPVSCSLYVKAKSITAGTDSTVNFYHRWKHFQIGSSAGPAFTWNRHYDDGEAIEMLEWGTAGCLNTSDVGDGYNTSDGSGVDRKATATGSIKFTTTSAHLGVNLDTTQFNDGLFVTSKVSGYVLVANATTTNVTIHGETASSSDEPYYVYRIQDMYPNRLKAAADIRKAGGAGMAIGGKCLRTARGKSTTNANTHAATRLKRPWTGNI